MARPQKENMDYFTHDNNMRNDPKLKVVRQRFGVVGYGVYCMLIETLSEANLLRIEYDEINCEIIAADFGISADDLRELVDFFCRFKLMKLENNYLFCPALDRRSSFLFDKRKESLEELRHQCDTPTAKNDDLGNENTLINEFPGVSDAKTTHKREFPGVSDAETHKAKQSKGQQRKGQQSKGNGASADAAAAFGDISPGAAIAALKNAGFSPEEAATLATQYGHKRCWTECDKGQFAASRGKIKDSLTGWIAASLRSPDGFAVSGYKSPQQRAAEAAAEIKKHAAEEAKAAAEKEKQALLDAEFAALPADEQNDIAQQVLEKFAEGGEFNQGQLKRWGWTDKRKSPLQILNNTPMLRGYRNELLQKNGVYEAPG